MVGHLVNKASSCYKMLHVSYQPNCAHNKKCMFSHLISQYLATLLTTGLSCTMLHRYLCTFLPSETNELVIMLMSTLSLNFLSLGSEAGVILQLDATLHTWLKKLMCLAFVSTFAFCTSDTTIAYKHQLTIAQSNRSFVVSQTRKLYSFSNLVLLSIKKKGTLIYPKNADPLVCLSWALHEQTIHEATLYSVKSPLPDTEKASTVKLADAYINEPLSIPNRHYCWGSRQLINLFRRNYFI